MHEKAFFFVLIVVIAFLLVIASDFFELQFDRLTAFLEEYLQNERKIIAAAAFLILAAISALFAFFSSVILVPLAVVVFGSSITLLLLLGGWMLGGSVAYLAGHLLGYPIVEMMVSEKKLTRWTQKFSKGTGFWFAFLFRFFTPSETGYVFGIFRYPFLRYLLITFLAELPVAFLAVYASDVLLRFL